MEIKNWKNAGGIEPADAADGERREQVSIDFRIARIAGDDERILVPILPQFVAVVAGCAQSTRERRNPKDPSTNQQFHFVF